MSIIAGPVTVLLFKQDNKYSDPLLVIVWLCIFNLVVKFIHSRLQVVVETTAHDSPDRFTSLSPTKQAAQ